MEIKSAPPPSSTSSSHPASAFPAPQPSPPPHTTGSHHKVVGNHQLQQDTELILIVSQEVLGVVQRQRPDVLSLVGGEGQHHLFSRLPAMLNDAKAVLKYSFTGKPA